MLTHDMLAAVQFALYCGVVCELDWLDGDRRSRLERIEAYLIERMTR